MASTPRPTRVSSRIAASNLLQQQQQPAVSTSSRSSSAVHSRASSPSPRHGSRADSWDTTLGDHSTNGHHLHHGDENIGNETTYHDDEGEQAAAADDSALDQIMGEEVDHAAFEDRSVLSTWEFAFVYGFLLKFKSLLRQNYPLQNISEQDLETALFATSSNSTIEQIHCNLLSNMQNRKKAVEPKSWQRALSETLDAKERAGELDFHNPLRQYRHNYYRIPPADRIQILKSLVEWCLQESTTVRQGLEEAKDTYLVQPFGTDQTKGVYWYFGEGSLKMYRETNPNKKNAKWETVANSLEDMRQLTGSFGKTTSNAEKALCTRIQTEIIEPFEEKQFQEEKRAERAEKKMLRLAKLHEMASMRTTRTRSSNRTNIVKYNYDDEEEEDEDEELYVDYKSHDRGQHREQQQQEQPGVTTTGKQDHATALQPDQDLVPTSPEQERLPSPSSLSGLKRETEGMESQALRYSSELTATGAMEMDTRSVRSDRLSDNESDTSISYALERTRMGDAPEAMDRSPKRMKMEVDHIPDSATTNPPFPSSSLLQAEAPSVVAQASLENPPAAVSHEQPAQNTTATSNSQPPFSAAP